MAGYIIYSLDWDKFQQFVNAPSGAQLLAFSRIVSDGLDDYDGEFDEDDPVQEWPSEPKELRDLVRQRLALPDWYGDLSREGKSIWEGAVTGFCCDAKKDVGFRVDSDGVYWDVIEIARRHHGIPPNRITGAILSHFGTRPYRYHPPADRPLSADNWDPYHSMHTPDEVRQLLEELNATGPAIEKAGREEALRDYEDELMPSVEKIAREGRVLFIQVDT